MAYSSPSACLQTVFLLCARVMRASLKQDPARFTSGLPLLSLMPGLPTPSGYLSRPEDSASTAAMARTRRLLLLMAIAVIISGCAGRQPEEDLPPKYTTDFEEMMPIPYTPRDDGLPLTANELHAFKTVSDLDRHLSEEDARIVELHFKNFVHQNRKMFQRFIDRAARFLPYVKKTFTDRGIPEDISYLFMVESGGNPNAKSHAGAVGLWQFIPSTGKIFGLKQSSWLDERRDPYKATYAASDYLLKLYTDFANWHLAVAAYNAGEGKIGRAVGGTGATDFFELCRLDCQLEERARLRDETRDYVPRLIAMSKIMRNLKRLGFTPPSPAMAWDLTPMTVPPGTNLSGLARSLDLTWDEFSGMNPAYQRTASPPQAQTTAYVPPDKLASAVAYVASKQARVYAGWKEYKVRRGDTLTSVAKRHKTSVAALKEANSFTKLPKTGTLILIPGTGEIEPVYAARPEDKRSPAASAGVYTVRPGDTLYDLARRWGTSVNNIRLANRMSEKQTALKPGQRISIPGNAANKPVTVRSSGKKPLANAPVAKSKGNGSYLVKPGDTVYAVARANSVSLQALCEANNLDRSRPVIRTGQTLVIPRAVSATNSAKISQGKKKSVTVVAGDSLYGIARANNVSVTALQKANNLSASSTLKIGQKLRIP